jgi:hypothetical protein
MMNNNNNRNSPTSVIDLPTILLAGSPKKQIVKKNNNNNKIVKSQSKLIKPPQIHPPVIHQTFRFKYQSAGSELTSHITNQCLAAMLAFNTTSNSTKNMIRVIQCFELRKVKAWAMSDGVTEAQVAIDFSSTNPAFSSKGNVYSDATLGTAIPATVQVKPPPGSYAASWVDASTAMATAYTMFSIRTGGKLIYLDLDVNYLLADVEHDSAFGVTQNAVTSGQQMYYLYLDAMLQAVPVWVPVGIHNIWI